MADPIHTDLTPDPVLAEFIAWAEARDYDVTLSIKTGRIFASELTMGLWISWQHGIVNWRMPRDSMHDLLLWALYHHQGGSSPVGQPIRRALGIGPHDSLGVLAIQRATAAARKFGGQ